MWSSGEASIAICDRCNFKFKYMELRADGNSPGLRVCADCWDPKNPWRDPPIQPDPITLRFPRPDTYIGTTGQNLTYYDLTQSAFPGLPQYGGSGLYIMLENGSGSIGLQNQDAGIGMQ
jgi:hypothetical protein